MNDPINIEIAKLQSELQGLDKAVVHIEKAGKVSTEVIEATRGIQKNYETQLEEIRTLYDNYLNNSYEQHQSRISALLSVHEEQTDSLKATADRYKDIPENIANQLDGHSQKVVEVHDKYLDLAKEKAYQNLDEVNVALKKLISETSASIEMYRQFLKNATETHRQSFERVVEKHIELLQNNFENAKNSLAELQVIQHKQIEDVNKILEDYLKYVELSKEIAGKLDTIDFPTRLDLITETNNENTAEIQKLNLHIDKNAKELYDNINNTIVNKEILSNFEKKISNEISNNNIEIKSRLEEIETKQKSQKTLLIVLIIIGLLILWGIFRVDFFMYLDNA